MFCRRLMLLLTRQGHIGYSIVSSSAMNVICRPPPLSTLFVAIVRFRIPLSFFSHLYHAETMKNIHTATGPQFGSTSTCMHPFFDFCPSILPSLPPFRPPPSPPQPFPALCTFVIIHSQQSGKNKGDKKKVPRHPSQRQTQNSIPGVYLASLQVMPYFSVFFPFFAALDFPFLSLPFTSSLCQSHFLSPFSDVKWSSGTNHPPGLVHNDK
ncbi:MAG: hypothetical protein JOS17DRAFT_425765 [Linnemannia elongata]|nr:MAG: hypothetical protein JOS17DRAFT_425765 [Linnemannia elongata]